MHKSDAMYLVINRGKEVISFGGLISPPSVNIEHKVKIGNTSFTDGKIMETGLFEFMINDEEDEFNPTFKTSDGLFTLKAVTAHEYGHVWFSNFKEFIDFSIAYGNKFEKEGISLKLGLEFAKGMANIIEDGRIEQRMCNMFPGLIRPFIYLNGIMWEQDSEEMPESELSAFQTAILRYTKSGIMPKWYKTTKGHRIRDEFDKIKDLINQGVKDKTCKKALNTCGKIIDTCWDYIIELLKQAQEDQDEMDKLMESLSSLTDITEGVTGIGDGTTKGDGSESPRLSEEEDGDGDGDGDGDSGEDSEGSSGDEEAKSEDSTKKSGNGKKKDINKTGDNSRGRSNSKGSERNVPEYDDTKEMKTGASFNDNPSNKNDGGGSTKVLKSKNKRTAEEIIKESIKESSKFAEIEDKASKTVKKEEVSTTMTKEEISVMISQVGYDHEYIRYYREVRQNYPMLSIPNDILPQAKKFRRDVEKCFKEKNTHLSKMTSGKLDCRQLHRIGMDEYNLFERIANRSDTDAVVEICWDGSGSMRGGKQNFSGEACAIIEYGLKGIVPLKIINFSTDHEVIHYLVKDFNDVQKNINYSYSYTKSKGFNGGNKDGYDIRVCTQDLLKRPEKDKILIVLSDGLPTDYSSISPEEDVKDAVKCARKKGIIVIPIFFGDESFRNDTRTCQTYEYMYQKNIINSAPEELPNRLVKVLKSLVLK